MTAPPNPRHAVSGGCHNGDHIDEAEEDEANPDRERQPGEPRGGMRDFKNSSGAHRGSMTSDTWPDRWPSSHLSQLTHLLPWQSSDKDHRVTPALDRPTSWYSHRSLKSGFSRGREARENDMVLQFPNEDKGLTC